MPRVYAGVRARPGLTISLLVAATCGLLGWLLLRHALTQAEALVAERGQQIAEYVARNAERSFLSGDHAGLRRLGEQIADLDAVVYARIVDREGTQVVLVQRPSIDTESGKPIPREFRASITTIREYGRHEPRVSPDGAVAPLSRDVERIGTVAVGVAEARFAAFERELTMTAAAMTAALAVIAALCAAFVTRMAVSPIEHVQPVGGAAVPIDRDGALRVERPVALGAPTARIV